MQRQVFNLLVTFPTRHLPRIFVFGIVLVVRSSFAVGFQPQITIPLQGTNPVGVICAKLNSDSNLDICTANSGTSDISVLLGNGDGTFQSEVRYPIGTSPTAIAVADLNRDTAPDIITVNQTDHSIAVLTGNGDGTFQPALFYSFPSAVTSIALGDFNGDKLIDVAAAGGGQLAVALGNGNCSFQAALPVAAGLNPSAVQAGDFNGDGNLDLVVANSDGSITILLGNGDGTFAAPASFSAAAAPKSITVCDFNNDEKPDLFVTFDTASTQAFVNNTVTGSNTISFSQSANPTVDAGAIAAASADLRTITNSDLVTANQSSNSISVLVSNADGTFQSALNVPLTTANGNPSAVALGNVDNDPDAFPDVVTANSGNNSVTVFRQTLPNLGFYFVQKAITAATSSQSFRTTQGYSPIGVNAASFSFTGNSVPNPQPMTISGGTSATFARGSFFSTSEANFNDAAFNLSVTTPSGTVMRSVTLAGAQFPNDYPSVSSPNGFFIGATLYLDATRDIVITWNQFSNYDRHTRDKIVLFLANFSTSISTSSTSLTIPAYTLPANYYSPLGNEIQFSKNNYFAEPATDMSYARAGKVKFTDFELATFQAPIVQIGSVTRLPNGHVRVTGTSDNFFHVLSIRAAPSLVQPFRILPVIGTVVTDGNGAFVFEDDQPAVAKFYRATMP